MNKKDIYPLTIVKDRYMGTYSGGGWTAWNCDAEYIPEEIYSGDDDCAWFWSAARERIKQNGCTDDDRIIPPFGVGGSIDAAIEDLAHNIKTFGDTWR